VAGRARLAGLGAALVLALTAPLTASAAGGGGLERLQTFLERTQSMRAAFRQDIVDAAGAVVESSSGRMVLKRPDRFRWDYTDPYARAVVADGTSLWLYEADLQQATVRPLTAGLGETPAALLTGDRAALERFAVEKEWSEGGLDWVRLAPRSAESDFEAVAVGFAGDRPARLDIRDRLGQQTRVVFSEVELNVRLADDAFAFAVPEGVDVIREGGQ
jgi:outer membrane lipoprotein carrier protein